MGSLFGSRHPILILACQIHRKHFTTTPGARGLPADFGHYSTIFGKNLAPKAIWRPLSVQLFWHPELKASKGEKVESKGWQVPVTFLAVSLCTGSGTLLLCTMIVANNIYIPVNSYRDRYI